MQECIQEVLNVVSHLKMVENIPRVFSPLNIVDLLSDIHLALFCMTS